MMDGDIARESSGNDDFDIIGDGVECSTSGEGGIVVSVETDVVVTNGDDPSVSKQPVEEEFLISAVKEDHASPPQNLGNGDEEEEGLIEHSRIGNGDEKEDKPKASAEDLMDEFGISLDSGEQHQPDEEESKESGAVGDVVEEDHVAVTTTKVEEASVNLDFIGKDEEEEEVAPESKDAEEAVEGSGEDEGKESTEVAADDAPEDTAEDVQEEPPKDIPEDPPKDIVEEPPEDIVEEPPKDIPEETPEDIPEEIITDATKDAPKEVPAAEEDGQQDSAVDVTLDTSQDQDTSLDISQDLSLDVSLDKPQDASEEPEVPAAEEKAEEQAPTEQNLNVSGEVPTSDTENEGYRPGLTRTKSNRLDSSKFSKFETSSNTSAQSSDSEGSSGASKRHTFTGRLNMSRFSQFEQSSSDSMDSAAKPGIKRNSATRSKSLKFGSAAVTSEMCHVCQKRVYPMEKVTADAIIYHKTCFRCAECKKCLSLGKYAACKGNVFCLPHFKQNFKLKGNYDFTNNPVTPRQTNGVSDLDDTTDSINIDRGMEGNHLDESARLIEAPVSPSQNQAEESAPPSIIRSSDHPEESMQMEGGSSSVKSRFEKGEVSNLDNDNERGVSESTPVRREDVVRSSESASEVKVTAGGIGKFKNMFEKGGVTNLQTQPKKEPVSVGSLSDFESTNQGHVAESTPVVRPDVVRSTDNFEDPGIKKGFSKSLKSRFETERISNIEERPREKIEIASPEEKRVYQPPERTANPDVVNAQSQLEDPGIKSGQARSLRSLFEKGNVSNVEERPRPILERTPRSLEEFSMKDEGAESTPIQKADVVSSASRVDEPMRSAESTRSLKNRWETGQVERVPEQPKPVLERTPGSLDNYSMTMVVSENQPVDRTDIVKSSASGDDYLASKGSAGSLKAKWESGEVHNVDSSPKKTESSPKKLSDLYNEEEHTNGILDQENEVLDRENGLQDEEEEEEEEEAGDASWEIKAARAAAMAESEDE